MARLRCSYALDLGGREDQSLITWYQCDDAACANPRKVAVSRGDVPLRSYTLTAGDVGKYLRVSIQPKHNISDPGPEVAAVASEADCGGGCEVDHDQSGLPQLCGDGEPHTTRMASGR